MHARSRAVLLTLVMFAGPAQAEDSDATLSAAIAPNGDEVRLVTMIGGKLPVATLQVGKGEAKTLAAGDAIGALEVAHGTVIAALDVYDDKQPFRIFVAGTKEPTILARPGKRLDMPFALAIAPTPNGFTIFFQEVEVANTNEAHTYLVKLDKQGAVESKPTEVAVPWWLGDAAWNGKGYHLALYYAASQEGARLSMVTTDENGSPQGHPDWASMPGQLSDMHLVATGEKVMAYYRGGRAGERLLATDVTKIGQWGGGAQAAKDLGAFAASEAIAINAKGQPVRVKAAPVVAKLKPELKKKK